MNLNKALIAGRLTKDVQLKSTQTGMSVATFSVATSRSWKDKSGQKQEKSSFHNIVMWGKLAEICGQWLTKGQEVFIEGRIETRDYTDKQGNKRYVTEIVGENMQMGNKPKGYDQNAAPKKEEEIPTVNLDEGDDIQLSDVPF